MAMSLSAAAEAFREAIRETIKRYALWYFIEGVLLVVAGVLAVYIRSSHRRRWLSFWVGCSSSAAPCRA